MGVFSKEADFVVITCQTIFREGNAQNENNDLPNKAASERQQEKSGKSIQSKISSKMELSTKLQSNY